MDTEIVIARITEHINDATKSLEEYDLQTVNAKLTLASILAKAGSLELPPEWHVVKDKLREFQALSEFTKANPEQAEDLVILHHQAVHTLEALKDTSPRS